MKKKDVITKYNIKTYFITDHCLSAAEVVVAEIGYWAFARLVVYLGSG
jgi:hypothetical protein